MKIFLITLFFLISGSVSFSRELDDREKSFRGSFESSQIVLLVCITGHKVDGPDRFSQNAITALFLKGLGKVGEKMTIRGKLDNQIDVDLIEKSLKIKDGGIMVLMMDRFEKDFEVQPGDAWVYEECKDFMTVQVRLVADK